MLKVWNVEHGFEVHFFNPKGGNDNLDVGVHFLAAVQTWGNQNNDTQGGDSLEGQIVEPVFQVSDGEEDPPPRTVRGRSRTETTRRPRARQNRRGTTNRDRGRADPSQFQFTCQVCFKVFKGTSGKSKCQKKHRGPFECRCGAKFTWFESLSKHRKACNN